MAHDPKYDPANADKMDEERLVGARSEFYESTLSLETEQKLPKADQDSTKIEQLERGLKNTKARIDVLVARGATVPEPEPSA